MEAGDRLGIFGGTFDPIHLGHLRTAEEIGERLRLARVYLIPSAAPPHKTRDPVSAFHHRLRMAQLAVEDASSLAVLDLEGRRPGFSYSIETLKDFHRIFHPAPDLYFILGMDAFLELQTWKEYRDLFNYAHFVVISRAGTPDVSPLGYLEELGIPARPTARPEVLALPSGTSLHFLTPTRLDISATRIRRLVSQGRSIRFLVPERVRLYISEKKLYRNHGDP